MAKEMQVVKIVKTTDGCMRHESDGRAAVFSECGTYRYLLERRIRTRLALYARRVVFVMLNPSTATAEADDPTVRRCVRFAELWDYDRMHIVNFFGYRSPSPSALNESQVCPVGPLNAQYLVWESATAETVICAWGNHGAKAAEFWLPRWQTFAGRLHHLGLTARGQPKHPMARGRHRIPDDVVPQRMKL